MQDYTFLHCRFAVNVSEVSKLLGIIIQVGVDINYHDPSMLVMNGWPEEAQGGARGYGDARDHIEHLIKIFGKPKVSVYLQQFKQPVENNSKDRHP